MSENSELKVIDVNIYVDEGPRVYVNQINIDGNVRTIDKVIRREINLSEGDAYNKYNVNYSKDSIRALNFFSKVEVYSSFRGLYFVSLNHEISFHLEQI